MIRRSVLFLILGLTALTVSADQMTVADLQEICSGAHQADQSACRFYILGALDGAGLATGLKTVDGPFCYEPDVQITPMVQAVKVAMQVDLKAYPQDKTLPAVSFVTAAAMKAFPCKK
ncbi:MAG: hypothetical protein JO102_07160 [Elusimicrobia bacterium]|nr:hypothetical protein [Elusimicrobiota bacterium]